MNHTVSIVDYKKLSNGQFAIMTQCCGDAQHTSWHTMDASVIIDDPKYQASIAEHCDMVATHHEAAIVAEQTLKELVGSAREVTNVRSQ